MHLLGCEQHLSPPTVRTVALERRETEDSSVRRCRHTEPETSRKGGTHQFDLLSSKVDHLLDTAIGVPPRRFTVEGRRYTPKSYLRDYLRLGAADMDFVVLSHDPTRAWNRRYRESYAFNGAGVLTSATTR